MPDDWSIELEGVEQKLEEINDAIEDVTTAKSYLVGTAVEYSVYLELGTSKMDAKPFFKPAINEVRIQGIDGFIRHNTGIDVDALETLDRVLKVLAFALERRIKQIITQKGLVDTGTLRASVLAVPGDNPRILPDESEFSGFDSDNPAPPNAGRALVSEAIEI